MHPEAYDFVRQNCRPWRVCEFGSYNVNGSVRDLFLGWDYVGVDVRPGPGVDVVADCTDWPALAEGLGLIDGDGQVSSSQILRFDVVVCTESLEHIPQWHKAVTNAYKILKIGGRLVCTAAGPEREPHSCDGEKMERSTEFYQNVTPETLRIALKTAWFDRIKITVGRDGQDIYASAWS